MPARVLSTLLIAVFCAAPVLAQGKSQSKGRGAKPPATINAEPQSASVAVAGTGVRHFGGWLDDASFLPKGKGWTTFSIGYWRSPLGHQWDVPSLDAGFAVGPRMQVGMSAPVSYASYGEGYSSHGVGDAYVSAKVGLIDPDAPGQKFGLAVSPVVEILSSNSVLEGDSRFHWAIPVTAERRFEKFRIYGAAGYFSRGALFESAAIEVPLSSRVVATGTLSHSRSLTDDPLSDALELSKNRVDLGGGVLYVITETAMVFGSLGRTISQTDANASTLAVSAGISLGFSTVQTKAARPKHKS